VKYLPLFHHFKAIYQFPKHIIFGVKIVANASLNGRPLHLINDIINQKKKNKQRSIKHTHTRANKIYVLLFIANFH
jgi:hypothetical protein